MKRKVIQLKESELKQLISRIIEEQTASAAFTQGQQVGQVAGQQARQVVNKAATQAVNTVKQGANAAFKGLKEIVITIVKVPIKVLFYGAATVWIIGEQLYKVGAVIANAFIKFLASLGKVSISALQTAGQSSINALNKAGASLDKGAQALGQWLSAQKDSAFAIGKYLIDSFKQWGTQEWAKVLVAAAAIKELSALLGNYLKSSWASIQKSIGVAWENASNWASGMYNRAKQGFTDAKNAVSNKANQLAQSASGFAGKVLGGIQGFLQEMLERYFSFSNDTETMLIEAASYNGKVIL